MSAYALSYGARSSFLVAFLGGVAPHKVLALGMLLVLSGNLIGARLWTASSAVSRSRRWASVLWVGVL